MDTPLWHWFFIIVESAYRITLIFHPRPIAHHKFFFAWLFKDPGAVFQGFKCSMNENKWSRLLSTTEFPYFFGKILVPWTHWALTSFIAIAISLVEGIWQTFACSNVNDGTSDPHTDWLTFLIKEVHASYVASEHDPRANMLSKKTVYVHRATCIR